MASSRTLERNATGDERVLMPPWQVVFVVCIIAAASGYGLFIHHGTAPGVIGYNLTPSEMVLKGDVPYRDFIYNYTPGVLWLNALLFHLFGTTAMVSRLSVYAARVISAALLYLVGRYYLTGRLAALPVLMALAWVGYGDILKTFPTQYGACFLLAAWLLVIRAESSEGPETVKLMLLAGAGLLCGAEFVFKQNVGVFVITAASLSAIAIAPGEAAETERASEGMLGMWLRVERGIVVVAGFAVVAGAMCVYLATKSAFGPMIAHFLHHAVAYEEEKGIPLPGPLTPLLALALLIPATAIGFYIQGARPGWLKGYLVLVAGLIISVVAFERYGRLGDLFSSLTAAVYYLPIACAAASAVIFFRSRRYLMGSGLSARMASLVVFPLSAYLEIFPRADADHLIRVLPPTFLALCPLVLFGARLPKSEIQSASAVQGKSASPVLENGPANLTLLAITAVVIVLGLKVTWFPQFSGPFRFKQNTPLTFERGRGTRATAEEAKRLNSLVSYVDANTKPSEPVLILARSLTGLYFLAGRPNLTRMPWLDSPGASEQDIALVAGRIKSREFKLLLLGAQFEREGLIPSRTGTGSRDSRIEFLAPYYHVVAVIDGVAVLAPNT